MMFLLHKPFCLFKVFGQEIVAERKVEDSAKELSLLKY